MTRALVCGGTKFTDAYAVDQALKRMHAMLRFSCIIEGEAPGADSLARDWAQLNKIPVDPYFADWTLFGNRAGTIRNARMLREGKPDIGVAFPGANGTADMVRRMVEANVPVYQAHWQDGVLIWRLRRADTFSLALLMHVK